MAYTITGKKNSWEVSEVDLNLRHYSGPVSDVFKRIKSDIVSYLMSPNVTQLSRSIYSAIYNALDYYEILSPDFSVDGDFLASSIQTFNEDLEYLSEKYKSDSPLDPAVITLNARIKSPLSFVEKVKDKVNEYIEQNRNFVYFNESLRDIIGVRVVVDPPTSIKSQGLQAESNYVYDVFYDLMCHRGILEDSPFTPVGKFKFIDVNTRYDKNKLASIKSSQYHGKSILSYSIPTNEEQEALKRSELLVIPQTRPAYMEEIDGKVKDYRLNPKKSGYQSLHICVVPYYSIYVEKPRLPKCIIPPATSDYSIEYQFRDARENDFSEKGPASHSNLKAYEKIYHRLAVPSYIDVDDYNLPYYSSVPAHRKLLKPRNFGDNYQRFYGPSFEDMFNISYHMFKYTFDEKTQNEILAGKKIVAFDEKTNTYYAQCQLIPICVENSDKDSVVDGPSTIIDFIEQAHINDSNIVADDDVLTDAPQKKHGRVKLFKVISGDSKGKDRVINKKIHGKGKKAANNQNIGPSFEDDL